MTTPETTVTEDLNKALAEIDKIKDGSAAVGDPCDMARTHVERALSKIQVARCTAQAALDEF